MRGNIVLDSVNGEDKVGKFGLISAFNGVDLISKVIRSTNLLTDVAENNIWDSDPGSTGVRDNLIGLGVGVCSDGEGVLGELPIGKIGKRNIVDG